jgi:dihydropteroate synthase
MIPKIVGILNYTPDSFSDGGMFFKLNQAIERVEELFEDGADIVDIGATSTSYGKILPTQEEEWQRLSDLIKCLGPMYGHKISLDTFHPLNAKKAIDLGVMMINDVSGAKNPDMIKVINSNPHVQYVFMYSIVVPADKKRRAQTIDEIYDFGVGTVKKLLDNGINKERIIFDPGIGFVTGPELSLKVIANLEKFETLGVPIYIGHSRKSFFESITDIQDRDIETLAASIYMAKQGFATYLRVHNVAIHRRAFKVLQALEGYRDLL